MTSNDPCKAYRQSESRFYQELRDGAEQAFACLYQQTYRQCIPYALERGTGQDDARDLLQDCLAIFVDKIRDGSYVYQEGVQITTYFYRIYINQWKKSLESRSRKKEVRLEINPGTDDDDPENSVSMASNSVSRAVFTGEDGDEQIIDIPEQVLEAYDDDERNWIFKKLHRAFGLLAEDCRKMLHWFYVEDRSLREIATELGMTENSATVKRFKCAKYLKDKFHLG